MMFFRKKEREELDIQSIPVTKNLQGESDMVDDDVAGAEGSPGREVPPKLGRNEPCHCGSGKKYKKCCATKDEESRPKKLFFEHATKIYMVLSADRYPVERCLINDNWKKSRLAQIVVTREMEPGLLLFGVFLVDLGCLGVKNSFCNVGITIGEFEGPFMSQLTANMTMVPIGVQYAKEIIEGALAYGEGLGFKPDPDFQLSRHILGKEPVVATHGVQFGGDDGKPFFIAGPHDDANAIIRKLTQKVGKDGFHFIYPLEVVD